jgi:hypothetical protein
MGSEEVFEKEGRWFDFSRRVFDCILITRFAFGARQPGQIYRLGRF